MKHFHTQKKEKASTTIQYHKNGKPKLNNKLETGYIHIHKYIHIPTHVGIV
jgi:hypothetical protein